MKSLLIPLAVVFSLILGACTLREISLEEHGPDLAPNLGVNEEQLQFLSYCGYRTVDEDHRQFEYTHPGIVTMTGEEIVILAGDIDSTTLKEILRIPFQKSEVSQLGDHVQIRHGDNVTVIRTYVLDRLTFDQASSDKLFNLLILNQVKEYAGFPYLSGYGFYWDSDHSRYADNDHPPSNYEGYSEHNQDQNRHPPIISQPREGLSERR